MLAIVHYIMIKSNRANSFAEYVDLKLLTYIEPEMKRASSIDAVCDLYQERSLKNQTRMKRLGELLSQRRVVYRRPITYSKREAMGQKFETE